MPDYLARRFATVNDVLSNTQSQAAQYASEFTTDSSREHVMWCHRFARGAADSVAQARQMPGMGAYAQEQWGQPALDFIAEAQEIEAAADAVADWIEANFPTFGSVLNAALTALGTPAGQQDALRAQIGQAQLDYLLANRFENSALVTPTIPAAQLAGLVTLLNALAAAATI
jgi:hypothetical protein